MPYGTVTVVRSVDCVFTSTATSCMEDVPEEETELRLSEFTECRLQLVSGNKIKDANRAREENFFMRAKQ